MGYLKIKGMEPNNIWTLKQLGPIQGHRLSFKPCY